MGFKPTTIENLYLFDCTILNGASLSEEFPLNGMSMVGVFTPAGWTAAVLGFQVGLTAAGSFLPGVDNAGTPLQAVMTTGVYMTFPFADAVFGPWVKLYSMDAVGAAVNQLANRVFTVAIRQYLR